MKITSKSFRDRERIRAELAFCRRHPETKATFSDNVNPQLTWEGEPAGTKSFVLVCRDPDVPTDGSDVNQEGKVLSADLPRGDFFHWVLADIPGDRHEIGEGLDSQGVTPGGKVFGRNCLGARQGFNDYSNWFGPGEEMAGKYFGYDGPCPPWNDSIFHHYIFTVYALDIEGCPLATEFDGRDLLAAISGHILDEASITGTYSLNPAI